MSNIHQADDSYMAFIFQGMFALILLLDANDDEFVSVEAEDDVVLGADKQSKSLYQLKHSIKTNPIPVTEKNIGFWKTIHIWANHPDLTKHQYVFVTCAEIADNCVLQHLRCSKNDRSSVITALSNEADRVITEVNDAKNAGKSPLPHKDRLPGCQAFQNLSSQMKKELIDRITIRPNSFNLAQIQDQVENRISTVPSEKEIRCKIARRLMEWWDLRITEALTGKLPCQISKIELQRQIMALIADHYSNRLPDNYSSKKPDTADIASNGTMEAQIELVKGGDHRIQRAKQARWQAMSQRQQWLHDDFSIAATLEDFDDQLIEEWQDLFGPMCDDCKDKSEEVLQDNGRELLDWSHNTAPSQIRPRGFSWDQPFLIRGTYQQLADEILVGWHPNFKERLIK